ncbi:MAG: hypothetical protein ACI88A_001748 [Paraglaciecola sp.]|jgi:hypothetical protein
MCRNIKPLFNFDPTVSNDEVCAASIQFVLKVSGSSKPSKVNETAFQSAVDDITNDITITLQKLLDALVTRATPKDRKVEVVKAKTKATFRFNK